MIEKLDNKFIIVRHAQTKKDPTKHAKKWGLTKLGKEQSQNLKKSLNKFDISLIFTSQEQKAYLTALPIAKEKQIEISQAVEFNEVGRSSKYLTKEEFKKNKIKCLTDWSYTPEGGESSFDALTRFKSKIFQLDNDNSGKTIMVVSHGTILSLFLSDISKQNAFEIWENMGFCSWGVYEGGSLTRPMT